VYRPRRAVHRPGRAVLGLGVLSIGQGVRRIGQGARRMTPRNSSDRPGVTSRVRGFRAWDRGKSTGYEARLAL
jgi:hypothetical protein